MLKINSFNLCLFIQRAKNTARILRLKFQIPFNRGGMVVLVCGLLVSASGFAQSPTATQVAADMGVAWNLGNTLEPACGEGCWAPAATPELINAVAAAGFKTIRVPVAWDSHADASNQIDPNWLARVKEVVDYCYANNLYVIINNHWDNGWFDGSGFRRFDSKIDGKMQAYWTQIANTFINYDSHLLFCAANEPDIQSASETDVLLQYYQTFVDAVRATGGQNATRCLVLPGPSTNIDKSNNWMNTLPTDPTPSRLMIDVHYYDPYQFTLMTEDASWGNMFYYWGSGYHSTQNPDRNSTWGEEDWVESQLGLMQVKFVNNGVPVIIGEFGTVKRANIPELSLHIASREYWHSYVKQAALNRGIVPMYWDNGWAGDNGFALFDRNTAAVIDQGMIDVLTGGGSTTYYSLTTSTNGSGTISLNPAGGTYAAGTVVTVTANPASGWQFTGWSGDLSGSTNPNTITMNGNKSVTATFTNGGGATTLHVQSIVTGTQSAGRGSKRGTATITIYDDLGNVVSGATVAGTFSGTFAETVSGITDSNGTVVLATNGTAKGNVTVNLCVDNVTHSSLTYAPAQNVITCTGAGARFSVSQMDARTTGKEDVMNPIIYPNPSSGGKFTVVLPEIAGKATVSIYDGQGKLLYERVFNNGGRLDIDSGLKSGIYIVRARSEGFSLTKTLMIQ